MGRVGLPELLIILATVFIIFGANRLPDLGRGIGSAIKNFKNDVKDKSDAPDVKDKSRGYRLPSLLPSSFSPLPFSPAGPLMRPAM